ncbi:MAG: transposase [Actinomycetota bacterium]|nr:transposase [Actinomycetota bacterium]
MELPLELREALPDTSEVRPRLAGLDQVEQDRWDAVTRLRLRLLADHAVAVADLDAREKETTRELRRLIGRSGSALGELCGLAERSIAELLVEVGDPRRFTGEGGFARFNDTAPLPCSSGEGDGEPIRHRYNPGGNRRGNAVLHRMAVTQLRCEPRARKIYDDARRRGHTKPEAMRVLKRHLSDVVYRRTLHDLKRRLMEDHSRSAAA